MVPFLVNGNKFYGYLPDNFHVTLSTRHMESSSSSFRVPFLTDGFVVEPYIGISKHLILLFLSGSISIHTWRFKTETFTYRNVRLIMIIFFTLFTI